MDNFIIASSKPWHHAEFENISRRQLGAWFYVSCSAELEACLKKITPRYIFFLHWDWRVPDVIWQQHECVCFHMTDVPYGRGGSPLQNLILEGRGETKVTALIETFPAIFQSEEIIYGLKNNIVGLNCGRWDYIYSLLK